MTTPDFREKAKELMNKCIYKPGDKLFPFAIDQMVAQALSSAVEAENRACQNIVLPNVQELKLHAGEMTAQELRTLLAVLRWKASEIAQRRGEGK